MHYVVISDQVFAVNTAEEIAAAIAALREAGEAAVDVWVSPLSLEDIEQHGDPDSYRNGQRVFACSAERRTQESRHQAR